MGRSIVPIIPDEARTFGIDPMFREFGIYSSKGQLYEPVDNNSVSYYHEAKDGQILEEGITEAGSMSSFISAGTAYANLGINMIPFFIYYSMFGFQRIGDLIWLAGDIRAKGFLLGATYGRTTLNGEGLQHQDGHGLLSASTVPTLYAYDPAFAYEIAIIIADGMKRMYQDDEDVFYYLTSLQRKLRAACDARRRDGGDSERPLQIPPRRGGQETQSANSRAAAPIIHSALRAQEILAERYDVSRGCVERDELQTLAQRCDAIRVAGTCCTRRSLREKSYVETVLEKEQGPFVAVSDNMRIVPDQIAPWVPGGLITLGTDGFGRSDTRERLRRFFEVDARVHRHRHALRARGERSD